MRWTVGKIRKALGDRLIGSLHMREVVCRALLLLPPDIIEHVTHDVWFISSPEDAWAFTFRGSDIRHRHLIFLSDELLAQDERQIMYTVLHEVGHVVLNHRNSIGYMQTESEIKRQEEEAHAFAEEHLHRM